jgi:hypothetical protein
LPPNSKQEQEDETIATISQNSKRGFSTKHRVQAIAERIHLANAVLGEIERGISSWPQIPNKSKKILDGKSENSSGGKFPGQINRLHQEESYLQGNRRQAPRIEPTQRDEIELTELPGRGQGRKQESCALPISKKTPIGNCAIKLFGRGFSSWGGVALHSHQR